MRACFLTRAWRGGSGWFALRLAQALGEAGVDLVYVAPRAQPEDREPTGPTIDRVAIRREASRTDPAANSRINSVVRIAQGFIWAVRLRAGARVYIITFPERDVLLLPLLLLLRMLQAKILYIVHDATPHAPQLPGSLHRVEHAIRRLTYALPTHLVTLTESAKRTLVARYSIAPGSVSVIPHGVFETARLPEIPLSPHLLLFGTLRRNKRVKELIQAAALVDNPAGELKVVIAGAPHEDDRDYWAECEALIADRPGLFDCSIGFIAESDVVQLLARCSALILPYEDFTSQSGVAVLAGCNGRPVITTAAGGIEDLFAHGLAGVRIAQPVTPQSIAAAIDAFLLTPVSTWQGRVDAGRVELVEYLSWARIAGLYSDRLAALDHA